MSSVLIPHSNDNVKQKDIFRLAAAIYSESDDKISDSEIQLEIVKCMFVATGNDYLTKSDIISGLLDIYKYHISEDEINSLIVRSRGIFQSVTRDNCTVLCLTKSAYEEAAKAQENNIDKYIDLYITEKGIIEQEKCKDAIHVYLYELTTTNINSYRVLLSGKDGTQFSSQELAVDLSDLTENEKQLVHDFLEWDNTEKNSVLGNLVYCCLEYCLLINGDSPNSLMERFIRRREIYLDTNVIFRALGINGESRKKVIIAFLNKCKQAKLKLNIFHNTRKEFFDTIRYYTSLMEHYPRGNIYLGAYEQIADYNIFTFYEQWRMEHQSASLMYFISWVESLYLNFINEYGICDDIKIPGSIYRSQKFKDVRNQYSISIKNIKQKIKENYLSDDYSYTQRDSHDATVVRYIELLRENAGGRDIFLISSDKALRLWDMNRLNYDYPVVIYPSQLFLVLLKTCGRSENDYDSFVSFINIRTKSKQVSPENAHIILSGISSITEDIEKQKSIVEAFYNDEFQNVIKSNSSDKELYKTVQRITQNYLDEELQKSESRTQSLREDLMRRKEEAATMQERLDMQDSALTDSKQQIKQQAEQLKIKQERIEKFAERKIMPVYIIQNFIIPCLLVLLTIVLVIFIFLQFFFIDKEWNFSVLFLNWVKATYFGTYAGDYVYIIDLVLVGIVSFLLKKWMKNPFDTLKRVESKKALVKEYIDNNKLW